MKSARPDGRGRDVARPDRLDRTEDEVLELAASLAPALSPMARNAIDHSDIQTWMADADTAIRQAN